MFARFERFLVSNCYIAPMQISYYVKWVTNCYADCKCQADKIFSGDQKNSMENIWRTLEKAAC